MNDLSALQLGPRGIFRSLSMGVKLIVVCGLALLMTIPSFFVWGLVNDRTKRAEDVVKEISGHVGGPQTSLGRRSPYRTVSQRNLWRILRNTASTWCFLHKLLAS